MLQKLVIRNYAIIEHLTIAPDAALNTVTGETGAGKSIILGALSLILGERADTSVLINKEEKSVIEGYFDVRGNSGFRRALEQAELDYEDQCIIRREIAASGKTRAFVNDTPVTLQVLHELTSMLVDLQQQFGHTVLEEEDFQVSALDAVAETSADALAYKQLYIKCKATQKQLAEKRAQQERMRQETDYKQYQLDELLQAALSKDEIELAEVQLKQLSNAERIITVLEGARQALGESEQPMVNELKRLVQQLQSVADVMPSLKPLAERLNSVWAELKDLNNELESEQGRISLDPEQMELLQQRLDTGYKLLKKHGVKTTAELLDLQAKLEGELLETGSLEELIHQLEAEAEAQYKEVLAAAAALSSKRKAAAPAFAARVTELLALVGMPNARFDVRIADVVPNKYGADDVQMLLDANRSGQFLPVHKAASGGEMSRIMLCIKSMIARALHLPTLIFDEVDTGISGEAARQVGILLQDLGRYHQVLCITHQPQVAAKGDRHFYVYKEADGAGRLSTQIRVLQPEERVQAIARMIGGEQPSGAAMSSARELLGM